jgi:hypothetical protein
LIPSPPDTLVAPPSAEAQTIGIIVGVVGFVLIGSVVGTILVLRAKRKACFANLENRNRTDSFQSVSMKAYS